MHSNKRWPVFILSIALILGILQPYPIVSAESEQTYENYDENDKDASGEINTDAFDASSCVQSVKVSYQSGGRWVSIDENTRDIPVDTRLKITMTYEGVSKDDVIAHGNTMKYTLPELLVDPSVAYNLIQDSDGNEIGTIQADTDSRAVFLTFTDEFFQKEEQEGIQQIDGSFSFYAGADREKLKEDPDPVLIVGNQQIPLHFEKDSDARLGNLNLGKSTGVFGTDEEGAWIQYTLTVTTGDTAMPDVKVTDHFTSNVKYIDRYMGVSGNEVLAETGENAEDRPYETGDQAGSGSIYLGNLITSDQPVPDPAGDSYSAPGILVWHVGDMGANETRNLTYKARLTPEYTGGQNRGTITNTASVYSKEYPHQSVSENFTPSVKAGITKTAGAYVPDAYGDGGTITYQVTVRADENNTYDLNNVKIYDNMKEGGTEVKYLPSLDYVEGSFHLYEGGTADVSRELSIEENPHAGQKNPAIVSSDTEKRFDLYAGTLKPGEQKTLTYQVRVKGNIFAAGNEDIGIKNAAAIYSDDTVSGGNYQLAAAKTSKTLGKKVWDRKLQSEKTEQETTVTVGDREPVYKKQDSSWQEDGDADRIFTVPEGSFRYQVVVNEAADWNVSSSIFGDILKNDYLIYTGYLKIDYYEKGLSTSPATDAEAVRLLEAQTPARTVWADIQSETQFSFSPTDLGLPKDRGAFVLTYYASPNHVEDVSQVTSGNSFELTGTAVGPGGSSVKLSGVRVSTSAVVEGGKNLDAVKSGWYFDHNKERGDWKAGHLYWVIDVTGSEIDAGTEFKDVPSTTSGQKHLMRRTSMVGLYVGKLPEGKTFTEYYGSVKDLEADSGMRKLVGNVKNKETVPANADYSWDATNEQATIQIRKMLKLQNEEHLYIVLQTAPASAMGTRDCRTFVNSLEVKDSNASEFVKANEADIRAVGAGTNFKELVGVYEYDGSAWKNIQQYWGNSYAKLITSEIKEPGTYVEWRIKINYAGDLEGTVHVEDLIPEGMDPVYARYFWISPDIYYNAPEVPEIPELEEDASWMRMEITNWIDGNQKGPKQRTCIAYYNAETRQLRFDVTNLQKGGSSQDKRSLEIQIVTKVSDSEMMLNGVQKSYTNVSNVTNESQNVISNSSAVVTLTKKTITKTMGNVTNNRLPFTLTVNRLGEDIVKGEDTLTLVDEIKSPLQFELDSLVVKDKNGNTVQGVTARIEETDTGQKITLTVPDGKKLTVTYEASLHAAPNQDISVDNSAYWFGYRQDMAQIKNATVQYHVEATAGISQSAVLCIKKADQDDTAVELEGADFTLQQVEWNAEAAAWSASGSGQILRGSTDETGTLLFGTGGTKLEYNTVYCLRETKAPDGYVLDSTPRYYVIAKAQDEVYPEELEQWRQHGAEIYYSGSTYKVTIYNQRGTLMLNKKFQDVNGNEITGTRIPDGTYRFGLYAYKENRNYKNETALQIMEITCKNGKMTYKRDGTLIDKPQFAQLSVGARYCVLELDENGIPAEKNGEIYTMESGLDFRVEYARDIQMITISQNGGTDPVEIINRQYVRMTPGTGIFTGSNGIYESLLAGVIVAGIVAFRIRRRRT